MGRIQHPTPQSREEMARERLGVIAGAARDVERSAMEGNVAALKIHFEFLKAQIRGLDAILMTPRQTPREL